MDDIDWAAMADILETEAETYSAVQLQALAELGQETPRRILDIGSGPGVAACRFAETFPQAEVVAVDKTPELLTRAERRADRLGVKLRTQVAEFPEGLNDLGRADLVWSGQAVHHVGDQQDALNRLAALLEPGGTLAIIEGGLPPRWLPRDVGFGRPGLQPRLDAAVAEMFSQMRADLPGSVRVAEDWPAMLRTAGLVEARSKTVLVDHPAPVSEQVRGLVRRMLERLRSALGEVLLDDDLATLDRLLDPADPASVDQRADLFLLTAQTVHFGRKPEH